MYTYTCTCTCKARSQQPAEHWPAMPTSWEPSQMSIPVWLLWRLLCGHKASQSTYMYSDYLSGSMVRARGVNNLCVNGCWVWHCAEQLGHEHVYYTCMCALKQSALTVYQPHPTLSTTYYFSQLEATVSTSEITDLWCVYIGTSTSYTHILSS